MGDSLFDLLVPEFEHGVAKPQAHDPVTVKYLQRLSTLQLAALETTEPLSLAQAAHSTTLSLQALASRSSRSLIKSSEQLKGLEEALPEFARDTSKLAGEIAALDRSAVSFSEKYSRAGDNPVLERRKKALLMARNVDRLGDILELPVLLSSAIHSATSQGAAGNANYASALDLHSHIKRLHMLYPDSALLGSIHAQAEDAMREMTSNLISSLKAQNIKLAGGMRTVGWLRRIAPSLAGQAAKPSAAQSSEGALGALFLVCRLSNLLTMLEALEPLRDLADQETESRKAQPASTGDGSVWAGGQHTERYLKRYIEIFREQSFAMVSMFRSVFPLAESTAADDISMQFKSLGLKSTLPEPAKVEAAADDLLATLPTALTTLPLHLVDLLAATLRKYLPNVRDKSARESLLTQILYCAGSFGRLGGDFSMILALLGEEDEDAAAAADGDGPEWVAAMRKHKVLAGKLESLAINSAGVKAPVQGAQLDGRRGAVKA